MLIKDTDSISSRKKVVSKLQTWTGWAYCSTSLGRSYYPWYPHYFIPVSPIQGRRKWAFSTDANICYRPGKPIYFGHHIRGASTLDGCSLENPACRVAFTTEWWLWGVLTQLLPYRSAFLKSFLRSRLRQLFSSTLGGTPFTPISQASVLFLRAPGKRICGALLTWNGTSGLIRSPPFSSSHFSGWPKKSALSIEDVLGRL